MSSIELEVRTMVEYVEQPLLNAAGERVGTIFIGRRLGTSEPPIELARVLHPPGHEPEELRWLRARAAELMKRAKDAS